ncbi:hypothetical protein J2Y69_001735 [Microbacterium resistens]|uniref:Uncharacterized protein n=1 Tax=Microbacterium resistens TaxID=156977 RepID=A0ABU1SC01_9MICO|nr:hypothetical protein [Microbacterium resistens]MDR6867136.1 hypothetical protein [Microbacterium resistens]
MGLFTQRPEEPSAWAALPGEPLDETDDFDLPETPALDPIGLGAAAVTSIGISITPSAISGDEPPETEITPSSESDSPEDSGANGTEA